MLNSRKLGISAQERGYGDTFFSQAIFRPGAKKNSGKLEVFEGI
jgi:hypothetical protein